jgi:hypothetical protein
MKQSKFLEITVPVPHYTSRRKAGTKNILLPHGSKGCIISNLFAPDHDRAAFEKILEEVRELKPNWIIVNGRAVHDHAFELMAPRAILHKSEDEPALAPEVLEAYESCKTEEEREAERRLAESGESASAQPAEEQEEGDAEAPKKEAKVGEDYESRGWEARVLAVGKLIGRNIFIRLVEAAGPQCKLYYIPALEGSRVTLPPESNIKDILKRIHMRVSEGRSFHLRKDYNRDNYPKIPWERRQFAQLLGIDNHPQIEMLKFGSTIKLHCMVGKPDGSDAELDKRRRKVFSTVRVEVGKRKVMHPITEGYNGAMLNSEPTITSFPPQLANGWWTKCVSADVPDRKHLFFSQIGMMFARERHDFGDGHLERYATGAWFGYNWRGALHGKAFPFIRGVDGRRHAHFWSNIVQEEDCGDMGRQDWEELR